MPVVADFSVVVAANSSVSESTDDTRVFSFGTGGCRSDSALCSIDYSWSGSGADQAHVLINDRRIGTLRVNEQHASRLIAFDGSILSSGDSATANSFRVDVDSPTAGRTLTLHSVTVFYHQKV